MCFCKLHLNGIVIVDELSTLCLGKRRKEVIGFLLCAVFGSMHYDIEVKKILLNNGISPN